MGSAPPTGLAGRGLPRRLREFVSNPIPFSARDSTAWTFAVTCQRAGLPEAEAEELASRLHAQMAQPPIAEDFYALETVLEKVARAFGSPARYLPHPLRSRPSDAVSGAFTATPVPFDSSCLVAPSGDPKRLKKLWDAGIACIPIPLGGKAGTAEAKPPKFKHLEDALPGESDWAKWKSDWYRQANTGILFGHSGPGIQTLYHVEVESFEEFWKDFPHRDYFLANTPVIASAKSAHIYIASDDRTPSGGTHHYTCSYGPDGKKNLEFRGHGTYAMAPGSLHPSSTPERPVVYRVLNEATPTILKVANVPAFVHHYFPALFGVQQQQADPLDDRPVPRDRLERLQQRRTDVFKFRRFAEHLAESGGEELATKEASAMGMEVTSPATFDRRVPFTAYDYRRAPREEVVEKIREMEAILRKHKPNEWGSTPLWMRMRDCGRKLRGRCPEHGDREAVQSHTSCRLNFDSYCLSDVARRIGMAEIPAPTEGGAYYHAVVTFTRSWAQPMDPGEVVQAGLRESRELIAKVTHRARFRGKGMSAGVGIFLSSTDKSVLFQLRLLFREEQEHDCAEAVQAITEGLNGHLITERRYTNPEHAALQMMEDSACNFLGMDDWDDIELFAAYFEATRRLRTFQTYGAMFRIMREQPKEDGAPVLCDVPDCGLPLTWVLVAEPPGTILPPMGAGPPGPQAQASRSGAAAQQRPLPAFMAQQKGVA